MYQGQKVIVVLPAYRAALTLKQTYEEIPFDLVDEVVLVDDKSPDNTVEVARQLGIRHVVVHDVNKGYGGNQKSCYDKAKELGADIVVGTRFSNSGRNAPGFISTTRRCISSSSGGALTPSDASRPTPSDARIEPRWGVATYTTRLTKGSGSKK